MRSGLLLAVVLGGASGAVADTINVPGDQPTIQAGIDAAQAGDDVLVAPGVYDERINLLGKAIELHSSDGADVTIIDAGGLGTVIMCNSFESVRTVIRGFTITRGNSEATGGGMYNQNSDATIRDCIFLENDGGNMGGGGIYNSYSSPTIIECVFEGNIGNLGGGMFNSVNSFPVVTDCLFSANIAFEGGVCSTRKAHSR